MKLTPKFFETVLYDYIYIYQNIIKSKPKEGNSRMLDRKFDDDIFPLKSKIVYIFAIPMS